MAQAKVLARAALDVAVMAGLSLLVLTPLAPAYGDPGFWLAAVGGVLLGTSIAVLATRFRLGALEATAMAAAAYFLFGGLFALRSAAIGGVIPSVTTLRDLALSAVFAWKELLTVSTPAVGFEQLFVVPYIAGLIGSLLAVSFALRLRRYAVALLPVGVGLVFAISFGDYDGWWPTATGAVAAVASLAWLVARGSRLRADQEQVEIASGQEEVARAKRRKAVLSAITLALAATLSVAGATPGTAAWQRAVLREQLVPPLELHDFASPLMSFRKYVEDKDSVMFTVSGLPAGGTIRIATLDLYDGVVYKVSGAGGPGSGTFNRVGRTISGNPPGTPTTLQIAAKGLGGVWVPDAGYLTGFGAEGPRADQLTAGLHYNRSTGTVIDTAGVQDGDSFVLRTNIAAPPSDAQLDKAQISAITTPAPEMVPDALQDRLDEAIVGAETPMAKVRAICAYLHDKGTFSHGLTSGVTDSRPGHTWERINTLLVNEQMVGDQEQYAVAAALMAAQVGVPVRVVMGFAPKQINATGVTEVKGGDISAWIEVPVDGYGWVALNPSPPEDKKPQQQVPKPRKKPQPQVPQPPQQPQEPATLPPDPPSDDNSQDQNHFDWSWVLRALGVAGISLGVLAVLFGPALAMLWWKARRRSQRLGAALPPDRVSGAWSEVLDAVHDSGTKTSPIATRRETAALLSAAYPQVGVRDLADRADAAVFGETDPSEQAVADYWQAADAARAQIVSGLTWKQKLKAFFWPTSVVSTITWASVWSAVREIKLPWRQQ